MARTLVISFRSVRPTDCYNLESHKYVKNIIPARRNLPFGAATIVTMRRAPATVRPVKSNLSAIEKKLTP